MVQILIRNFFIGSYAILCFSVFCVQANAVHAPVLIADSNGNHEIPLLTGKSAQIEKSILDYLLKHMHGVSQKKASKLARLILNLSKKHDFHPRLILSIIHVESSFQPWAVSRQGALGLMQVMPETGEWLAKRIGMKWTGPAMLFDEKVNLALGVRYLVYLRKKYHGDLKKMLSAYNQGPGKVDIDMAKGRGLALAYYHRVQQHLQAGALKKNNLAQEVYVD